MSQKDFRRREILKLLSIAGVSVPVISTLPGLAMADANSTAGKRPRMVWIMLRGGMDGLGAIPPYGEGRLSKLRPSLAPDARGDNALIPLDGLFGLHHQLPGMAELYKSKELIVAPAVGSNYRGRSHFDGQKILENGTHKASTPIGWMNRMLSASPSNSALAVSAAVPLILSGPAKVNNWSPSRLPGADDDLLKRLEWLYRQDPQLSKRLQEATETEGMVGTDAANARLRRNRVLPKELVQQAARFLADPNGPNVITLESGGWDTHSGQAGRLAGQLRGLDTAIATLRSSLGEVWKDTVVVITSEFGRTVKENGTKGTDHGTGGALFMAGGAVNGGRIIGDWPGLGSNDLYEGRDLYPATDTRAILKGVLHDHLGVAEGVLHDKVFPGSGKVRAVDGLVRST